MRGTPGSHCDMIRYLSRPIPRPKDEIQKEVNSTAWFAQSETTGGIAVSLPQPANHHPQLMRTNVNFSSCPALSVTRTLLRPRDFARHDSCGSTRDAVESALRTHQQLKLTIAIRMRMTPLQSLRAPEPAGGAGNNIVRAATLFKILVYICRC